MNQGDNLTCDRRSPGLAAAEVVAALLRKPAGELPEEVTAWVAGRGLPEAALVEKAQRVVKRVLNDSELKELWAESQDSAKWRKEVEGLLLRLSEALQGYGLARE